MLTASGRKERKDIDAESRDRQEKGFFSMRKPFSGTFSKKTFQFLNGECSGEKREKNPFGYAGPGVSLIVSGDKL